MSAASVPDAIARGSLLLGQLGQAPAATEPIAESVGSSVRAFQELCREVEASGSEATAALTARAASADVFDASAAQTAARMLAEISSPEGTKALLELALGSDITRSIRAWFALGNLRRSAEHYDLVASYAMRRPNTVGEAPQNLLADSLGRQLYPGKYEEACAWAQAHQVPYVRQAIFKALARRGGPEAIAPLQSALTDADPVIAAWAAFGLLMEGERGEPLEKLLALHRAKSKEARTEAVSVLGWLPSPAAVAPVLASTQDPAAAVRMAAIVGAGGLGVRESLTALAPLLAHQSASTLEQAASILQTLLGRDPGYAWKRRALTSDSLAAVQQLCLQLSQTWEPGKRYLRGELATAQGYAAALYFGDSGSAYWSLVGMSRQRFDYDPTCDVIANWEPLQRLSAWANAEGSALQPGGFYLNGELLS